MIRVLGVDQLTKDPSSSGQKYIVFVKSSADDTKVSIPDVERPWLSKAKGFILPNHDTGRILLAESQRNPIDPSVAITDSSATMYDSADESSVCSTPLPPLKKLNGVEPASGPNTIKSILRLKSTFKAETLKGTIINEPSSALVKGNKNSLASVVNSAPASKLKSVKIKDDPPLAIVMKELNNLKLQFSKNQSSYSRILFCKSYEKTAHGTCDHAEYISTMKMSQHLKSLVLTMYCSVENDIKQSKQETTIHQVSGLSKGADLEPEGDSDDDNDQQSEDERTESSDDKSALLRILPNILLLLYL
ncbi:hypothetical protein Tco_1172388 [Tanacetum coccineum]